MPTSVALVIAQGSRHAQQAPDTGVGVGLIIGAVVLVILIAAGIFYVFSRSTRASRGGAMPPKGERPAGQIDPTLGARDRR
jgi:hypothetical protein